MNTESVVNLCHCYHALSLQKKISTQRGLPSLEPVRTSGCDHLNEKALDDYSLMVPLVLFLRRFHFFCRRTSYRCENLGKYIMLYLALATFVLKLCQQ